MSGLTKVLLATADEGRRIKVAQLLRRAGYIVHTSSSARETIHLLVAEARGQDQGSALLLVDQQSLGSSAKQVIQAVRNAELAVPMIVMSSFGAADDIIGCLRAGANDYLSLPVDYQDLLQIVQRAMSNGTVS